MFIQDPVKRGINITAESPDKEVIAFQKYCRQFFETMNKKKIVISFNVHVDLQALQLPPANVVNKQRETVCNKSNQAQLNAPAIAASSGINTTNSNNIFKSIEAEAAHMLTRSDDRIQAENEIIEIITKYIKMYKSDLNVHQYGSTTYGFGNTVDLNILVETGNKTFIAIYKFIPNIHVLDTLQVFLCRNQSKY